MHHAAWVAVSALFILSTGVSAQTTTPVSVALPRVFVGGGVVPTRSDADSRMRLYTPSHGIWIVDAGAAVSSRVGVGAEFAQPMAVTATTSGRSFTSSGRQQERVLMGMVRGRIAADGRIALDVVGGAGVLFQHHELLNLSEYATPGGPCANGCTSTYRETVDRRAPAFMVGGELPIRLGRHAELVAVARYYALRRGTHLEQSPIVIPWQFEWKSSTRFGIGVAGRAVW